jgi:hypothetical protein
MSVLAATRLGVLGWLAASALSATYCLAHARWETTTASPTESLLWGATLWSGWAILLGILPLIAVRLRGALSSPLARGALALLLAMGAVALEHLLRSGQAAAGGQDLAQLLFLRLPLILVGAGALAWLLGRFAPPPVLRVAASLKASRGVRAVEVPIAEVLWLSAEENYVALHTTDGATALVRGTLSELAAALAPAGFVRLHRRFVVRSTAIVARLPGARLELADGTVLPVGRRYRAAIGDARGRPCTPSHGTSGGAPG